MVVPRGRAVRPRSGVLGRPDSVAIEAPCFLAIAGAHRTHATNTIPPNPPPIDFEGMATPAVPAPLAQLPNALTVARLLLIPIFVVLMVQAGDSPSWPAGIVFGIAGVTDQIDGFLARRWHVESRSGRSPTRSPTG